MERIQDDICRFSLLYVEDEAATRELIGSMLKMSYPNIDVIFADNGMDALKRIQEHSFDLYLIDLMLPALNGLALCEKIISLNDDNHIMVLSGYGNEDVIDKCLEMGVKDYLVKPISMDSLILKITVMAENIFWKRVNTAKSEFAA
jgi:DNA-binding response OmpR family regulator